MNTTPKANHSHAPGPPSIPANEAASGAATLRPVGGLLINLERQLLLFGRLGRLSERQSKLVSAADTQPLVAVLAQRRQITSDLETLTSELRRNPEASEPDAESLSKSDRRQANKMLARIREHLQTLIKRDAVDARVLATRKSQTHAGIVAIHSGQRAVTAYGRTSAAQHPEPHRTSRQA